MSKITITQTQRLQTKLSPQQELKIRILQLSNLQLIDAIQEELLQNPVLEEDETANLQLPTVDLPELEKENKPKEEINWEDFFQARNNTWEAEGIDFESNPILDNLPTPQISLKEYLLQQLRLIPISDKEYKIGGLIIDNINGDGYFLGEIEEISKELKVDNVEIEQVLAKIQEFEPTGVGARNLKECLLIQVRDLGMVDSLLPDLIKNHLPAIQDKNYEQIALQMNISIDEVKELIKIMVKSLEPKPTRIYERFYSPQVIPEIIISKTEEEGFNLEVNDEWVPSLRVSSYYQKLLREKNLSVAENEYIQKKIKSALFFLECMEKRKQTLRTVARVIFETQKEFLDAGEQKLVPMRLEDIANEVEIHLSTVSRTIANKFVKTPQGVHPLKFFFRGGMQTKDGDIISTLAVQEKVKEVIDREDKQNPLSDSKIVEVLGQGGLKIAVRTVAKYREELRIPSSYSRKSKVYAKK
ncbi:MAG: RNA polymerase factor sigma-54 [bacterium]|nr:RNA polymerase factor sigma-54 [bacterium]